MSRKLIWFLVVVMMAALPAAGVFAQETVATAALPASYKLTGFHYEPQAWNNCGPATLTNALSYFGYADNQKRAAFWLKPNELDKNVNPSEMVDFVNTQVGELPVYALNRSGGTIQLLKTLLYHNFPVIIEAGYDPEPDRLGWMGHYLLLTGYDDSTSTFTTHDSYIGPDVTYTYEHVGRFWKHFNYTFIALYQSDREGELMTLLDKDGDSRQNAINALEIARAEAVADPQDPFSWFNMGTNFVKLGMFAEAAVAYDQARSVGGGLPWRMLWYQFGPYEAYLAVGRPDDVIALARVSIENGKTANETLFQVEETYYYAGLARELKGEIGNAILNFNTALQLNPNFTLARDARDRLSNG